MTETNQQPCANKPGCTSVGAGHHTKSCRAATAAERAERQRRADAASKPTRLIDLQQVLLAVPPRRADGRGVDSLIPTRYYGVEARFADGAVYARHGLGADRGAAESRVREMAEREDVGLTRSSRDPFTRLSFHLIERESVISGSWRAVDEGACDPRTPCGYRWPGHSCTVLVPHDLHQCTCGMTLESTEL